MLRTSISNYSIHISKAHFLVPSILLFLLIVHLAIYVGLNFYIRGGILEHPDSKFYHVVALTLARDWREGYWHIAHYPEYANLLTIPYAILGTNRIWGELLNIFAHITTAFLAYKTVKNLNFLPKQAPILALLVVGLNPYELYISTQLLKDSIVVLAVALLVFSFTLGSIKKSSLVLLIGSSMLMFLREEFGAAGLVVLLIYTIFLLAKAHRPTSKKVVGLVLPVFIVLVPFSSMYYFTHFVHLAIVDGPEIRAEREFRSGQVEDRVGWLQGQPHIEFFDNRNPVAKNESCRTPSLYGKNVVHCSGILIENVLDSVFFPYPWQANTVVEAFFGLYMIGWYGIVALGTISLLVTRPKITIVLLLAALMLVLPLSMNIIKQSAFVRWRLPVFYLVELALVISISQLFFYEYGKRALDIILSLTFLLLTAPITLAITLSNMYLLVPIFYSQVRAGKLGVQITVYKFTTLIESDNVDESPTGLAPSASGMKYTAIGKLLRSLALDEIPQLVSILKGDISLVGPRTLDWELHTHCKETIPNWTTRNKVIPGVTGLAQLNTNRLDNFKRLYYDIQYVNNPGMILDLKLITKGLIRSIKRKWH